MPGDAACRQGFSTVETVYSRLHDRYSASVPYGCSRVSLGDDATNAPVSTASHSSVVYLVRVAMFELPSAKILLFDT